MKKRNKKPQTLIIVCAAILLIIAGFAIGKYAPTSIKYILDPEPEHIIVLEEYSDFQCPFCKKAVPTVKKIKELYGDDVKIEYKHFPLDFHPQAFSAAVASECARNQNKFWEYHDLLFENQGSLSNDLYPKLAKQLGLDIDRFNTCTSSEEARARVQSDMDEGRAKGVTGTPTFYVGDKSIGGAQPVEAFIPMLDEALGKEESTMDQIYANEPEVEITIVNDPSCADCDASAIQNSLQGMFPKHTIINLDVKSEEGKQAVETYQLTRIPSFIFSKNIEESTPFKQNPQIKNAFDVLEEKLKLKDGATGATHFIDPAAQAEYELALEEARRSITEKLEIGDKPQVDFFVMSYCPYGNQAEEAIEVVYQNLKEDAVFKPRYVIYENYRGGGPEYCLDEDNQYCSMHGIQELNQNIRERCVYEDFGPDQFFAFVKEMNVQCSHSNADTCWTDVAKNLGLNTEQIATCQAERGLAFVQEDKELGQLLGVSGSPTVFMNAAKYEGARTPQAYQDTLCSMFDNAPEGCGQTLTSLEQLPKLNSGGCGV